MTQLQDMEPGFLIFALIIGLPFALLFAALVASIAALPVRAGSKWYDEDKLPIEYGAAFMSFFIALVIYAVLRLAVRLPMGFVLGDIGAILALPITLTIGFFTHVIVIKLRHGFSFGASCVLTLLAYTIYIPFAIVGAAISIAAQLLSST